ncbi:MAG: metallophosphoesterase, partial [Balneolaceae bacterium]|nr:metallophosphoesterase [Balneolaceae bacterium]
FEGLPVTYRGEKRQAVIRTMEAQLTSTRLFNENYFAFLAALDNAVDRGIKYIALPGDFSDDGQPAHVSGLMEILNRYRDKHGVSFFLTPGNHDPGRPFETEAGKSDYLGEAGKRQPVYSDNHPRCFNHVNPSRMSHAPACTDEVQELGYNGLFDLIGDFGLKSNVTYHYYETPFSGDQTAQTEIDEDIFDPDNRFYEICHEGTGGSYRQPGYTNCLEIMDMSYLVEPVEGLWLLALDTNVYIPQADADTKKPTDPSNFSGSGNNGYNKVITHKEHLIEWMTDVAQRADEMSKTLISFSHFPAADFYNGAGPIIERVWGDDEFQMIRLPSDSTTQTIARTGVGLHIAGHMHMNGTEVTMDSTTGQKLTNIQVPSLAAYVPAYKIVRIQEESKQAEVETVTLNDVPDFDTLFQLYETEWNFLDSIGYDQIWNREILESTTYFEFTNWHIRELSRLRFLPQEWPEELQDVLRTMTGSDLLVFSQLDKSIPFESIQLFLQSNELPDDFVSNSSEFEFWEQATWKAASMASDAGFSLTDLSTWDGADLSTDFYRIRNAGDLALRDISPVRMEQYSFLANAFSSHHPLGENP